MRRIYALLLFLISVSLIYLVDNGKHGVPGIGKLLSPTHGIWRNASPVKKQSVSILKIKTPDGTAEVYYDERAVPHIFAPNERALYYAQGYVQAMDRLWQMDFQVRIAAGRLSEVIGEEGLSYDRFFRRIGIPKAADEIIAAIDEDPLYLDVVTSFTAGVNAYMATLSPRDYPLEFKLAEYRPEPWTLRKSVLLLKLMAFRLSGSDSDVAASNTLRFMDIATYNDLFPEFPSDQSPIIPVGTPWDFTHVPVPASSYDTLESDESDLFSIGEPPLPYHKVIGSNNWAVGKDKTASGGSILCNDPHLWLSFPSIWYEMQLNAPGINVYGVTIPGSPCIIIGFNEEIAWGVTNAGRDVRDWYSLQYKDGSQGEYLFEGEYRQIEKRIETIAVKGKDDFVDTVRWTAVGPIVYDASFGKVEARQGLAVRWLALDVSNELKTFYHLNKAATHDDYLKALEHYDNPAQNFVFADREGNIAIKQQGKFRVLEDGEGKFVSPLETQETAKLNTFIPKNHNPYVYNPPRGFVSSANQHPTDSTYGYYYGGWFERYRNRRINSLLDSMKNATVEDMMKMQNDTYDLMAAEALPFLLANLGTSVIEADGKAILDTLSKWDHFNRHGSTAPSYFQQWFEEVRTLLWDELSDTAQDIRTPLNYETFEFIRDQPGHILVDNKGTPVTETVEMIINLAFDRMVEHFKDADTAPAQWQYYNHPSVEHLMSLSAFGRFDMPVGGSENSINAVNGNFGPSWRMIVELNDDGVTAYGVYPGGQSGKPGDPDYDAFLDDWMTGRYFQLNFYKSADEARAYAEAWRNNKIKDKKDNK